jgi:hypothetical protein
MEHNTKMTYGKLYGEAGLMYIRFDAPIEDKPNGQKKIGHGRGPPYSKLETQPTYKNGDGRYYSLLMGREFKPGRFVILLDFDNKEDENSNSGLDLAEKLKLDSYEGPKQFTPSGGLHYLFYADADQKDDIQSPTGVMYQGVQYNMDVKLNKNPYATASPLR